MNDKKICFIICANDELYLQECIRYINRIYVPDGMEIEILEIRGAVSMTAGYNEGMKSSDAKYKVYLHQDVFIKNRNFIQDIVGIFKRDRQIGMIGLVGSKKLPVNGVMWSGERVMYETKQVAWEDYKYKPEDGYREVACVDGLLMATQYDIDWREELFTGWDFYDISQSFEMHRHGLKVVVPVQNNAWYIHDDKVIVQLWDYNRNRKIFLEEYGDEIEYYGKPEMLLHFPEEFFVGEEREGFYVEPDMKLAWAAQMEVLAVIDKLCKENGIRYFADYRTLLGAVRHKGFIPWDADLDICMLREDYLHFVEIAQNGLPSNCLLKSSYLDEKWMYPYMRVINASGLPIDESQIEKFHGCPYIVGVDIFPLDNLPEDQAEADVLATAYAGLLGIAGLLEQGESKESIEADIQRVEDYLQIKLDREGNMINQIYLILDKISMIYGQDDCGEVADMVFYFGKKEDKRLKEWYKDTVLLPFENIQIPAPVGYQEVLTALYGDWKQIIRSGASHDYPFYRNQREFLESRG